MLYTMILWNCDIFLRWLLHHVNVILLTLIKTQQQMVIICVHLLAHVFICMGT